MSDIPSAAQEIFAQFRTKLNELFQMDRAELDFGIYRIMNVKRAEITRYLDHDLFPQVEEILASATSSDVKTAQEELAALEASLKDAGVDPSTSPKVQDLRARLATTGSQDELRQRAFSHLLTFFSRYYDKGDFISKRRYKDGTYMIPYNGEEVKLVWANMDQYYIKTSEYLRDYRFFLNAQKTLRMTFKLVEGDTDRDNIKGKNRIFRILEDEPEGSARVRTAGEAEERTDSGGDAVSLSENGLVARFEYVLSDTKQKNATDAAIATILERADRFRPYLEQKDEKSGKTLLEKHISSYTARNSEDYFIHKDLRGFLDRELDFFLKNEVIRIDDMLGNDGEGMQAQLHLARAIKEVGGKIIAMLAQIEEFQKKLWLKRKVVTSTNYLVTLDKIIEKAPQLLSQIAANHAQREEWVNLFAIDEITAEKGKLPGMEGVAYSEPLTEEFLRANDKLVVDTQFFDREFVATLLASFDDIDAETDGLLVHSENFQALNLLQERYREKVKCIYIDPPYNTEKDRSSGKFRYKDGYDYSSWVSFIVDRTSCARLLLNERGGLYTSIDDVEYGELYSLLKFTWGRENHVATVIWQKVHTRKNSAQYFSVSHDYIPVWAKSKPHYDRVLIPREDTSAYSNPDDDPKGPWKPDPVYANNPYDADYIIEKPNGVKLSRPRGQYWRLAETTFLAKAEAGEVVWGNGESYPMVKRYLSEVQDGLVPTTLFDRTFAGDNALANSEFDSLFGSDRLFDYPKPTKLIERLVQTNVAPQSNETILDFFAGSGTTGHAVINLNREDGGSRKYILVEMGEYFDTVLKPRMAKVVYSNDWKDGKPQSRDTGVSQLVKYIRLESYEDTLNNLTVSEQGEYSSLLEQGVDREFREGYLLGYMLDWEAGAARITTDRFAHPFDSILNVAGDTVGERKPVTVDLVETFNYLIGLTVKSYYEVEGCRIVEGHDPARDHVLVVWRDLDTTDNAALNDLFLKQRINIRDREFDLIYVNGDNNLENIRRDDETWKVRLIEHEFTARMFAETNV